MTHWYLTLWQENGFWRYRIESGPERQVKSLGIGHPGLDRGTVTEAMFSEWSRLSKAG